VSSSRVNNACVSCSDRKVKCSGEKTCRRCAALHLICTYAYHGNIGAAPGESPSSPMGSTDQSTRSLMSPGLPDDEDQRCRPSVSVPPAMQQQFTPAATSIDEGAASLQDSQLSDTIGIMPWLSWDWTEHSIDPADVAMSLWSNPTESSDHLFPVNEQWSMCCSQIAADGAANDVYASLQPAVTSIVDSLLNPVEHHRIKLIEHLRARGKLIPHCTRWLERENFQVLLKTYFNRHHRHTPIIHLATFNVVSCPTSLIFAIALVAASYMPSLGLRTKDTQALAAIAYSLTLHSDQVRAQTNGTMVWT